MRALQVDSTAWLWGGLLLLTVPLPWLLAALAAALVHELCHFAAIWAFKGQVLSVRIGLGGAVMETDATEPLQEICCALAGPVGSLLLVLFFRWLPRTALCGLIHGLFNLLPLYPLDGGRILRTASRLLWKNRGEMVCLWTERGFLVLIFLAAVFLTLRLRTGVFPLLAVVFLIIRAMERKRPCKHGRLGVQ